METLFGSQSQRRRSWRFWLLVMSPFVMMGACSLFLYRGAHAMAPAQAQVTVFHGRLDSEQYDAIIDAASSAFRGAVKRDAAQRYLKAVHDQAGACAVPARPVSSFMNSNTSGTTVRLQYYLQCSKGPLNEVITFTVEDGAPRLSNYQASVPFVLK